MFRSSMMKWAAVAALAIAVPAFAITSSHKKSSIKPASFSKSALPVSDIKAKSTPAHKDTKLAPITKSSKSSLSHAKTSVRGKAITSKRTAGKTSLHTPRIAAKGKAPIMKGKTGKLTTPIHKTGVKSLKHPTKAAVRHPAKKHPSFPVRGATLDVPRM